MKVTAPVSERPQARPAAPGTRVLQRKCACGGGGAGTCAGCEEARLRRKPASPGRGPSAVPPIVETVLGTAGQTLDAGTRGLMEARFGHDFGHVRIHTDAAAASSAQALDAHAYTVGHQIVFGSRQYAPATPAGAWLLAHELAHTIQQRGAAIPAPARLAVAGEAGPAEQAADQAAHAVLGGRPVGSLGAAGPAIHCFRVTRTDRLGADERLVHLDNGTRFRVRRVRWLTESTERVGFGRAAPGIDRQRVWLDFEWCVGENHGRLRVGANISEVVLRTIVQTITSGGDLRGALEGIDVTPFAEANVLQSGQFRITAGGEITIDREGNVTGGRGRVGVSSGPVDVTGSVGSTRVGDRTGVQGTIDITVTPGRRTETEDCRRERRRVVENTRFECQSERDIPPREERREVPVTDRRSRFVYFVYARDTLDARSGPSLAALAGDFREGFQVSTVRGFTSPEGPMARGRRFIGNEELARRRAAAAARAAGERCAEGGVADPDACFVGGRAAVAPTGEGELYTLTALDAAGATREVEGAPLAEHATEEFLAQEAEEPHRTPELTEELTAPGTTPQQKADRVYPLLRRAEIVLVRSRTETRVEQIPGRTESAPAACPEAVIDAAFPTGLP